MQQHISGSSCHRFEDYLFPLLAKNHGGKFGGRQKCRGKFSKSEEFQHLGSDRLEEAIKMYEERFVAEKPERYIKWVRAKG